MVRRSIAKKEKGCGGMTDRSGLVLAKMAALLAAVLCLSVYPLLLTAVDFDAALLEQPAAMWWY